MGGANSRTGDPSFSGIRHGERESTPCSRPQCRRGLHCFGRGKAGGHPHANAPTGFPRPERPDLSGVGRSIRTLILDHLASARRHVAEAERHVAHQREIIAQRERDGHDTATSKQLLDQFEELYRMRVADRDRLEQELDEISK
jgi:hypothetical protein